MTMVVEMIMSAKYFNKPRNSIKKKKMLLLSKSVKHSEHNRDDKNIIWDTDSIILIVMILLYDF